MNGKISLIRIVVCSVLLILPLVSLAIPPLDFACVGPDEPFLNHKPEPFISDRLPPYLNGLDLSGSQKAKITEIVKTQGRQLREEAEKAHKAHEALRSFLFRLQRR